MFFAIIFMWQIVKQLMHLTDIVSFFSLFLGISQYVSSQWIVVLTCWSSLSKHRMNISLVWTKFFALLWPTLCITINLHVTPFLDCRKVVVGGEGGYNLHLHWTNCHQLLRQVVCAMVWTHIFFKCCVTRKRHSSSSILCVSSAAHLQWNLCEGILEPRWNVSK